MKTKVIGFESANSFVKVYHNGKSVIYPNTVTKAVKESYKLSDKQGENETVYEINGQRVLVGQTVKYQTSSTDSIKRYASQNYYIESIIAISHFAEEGDNIEAVTGIPSNHYDSKDEAIRLIKENLEGEHTIIRNGESITFTIRKAIVTLQPLATFFYSVVDEFGNADEEMMDRFKGSETLVIDIGWGTTDLAELFGSGLVKHWTINTSMKTAYETILERMKEKYKDSKLATANIQLLDLEKHLRVDGKYKYSNEDYDCREIMVNVFEETAKDILTEVNNIRSLDQFRTVILTGGGVKALWLYGIRDSLTNPKTNKLEENIFPMSDTQLANAKGYYVYGKYLQG